MIGIVVTGHGNFASGLLSSVKVVAGEPKNVCGVDFTEASGTENLKSALASAIDTLLAECDGGVLVLADLMGGSPYNETALLKRGNTAIVAGANFPMLLSCIFERDGATLSELSTTALESGREGIGLFNFSPAGRVKRNQPNEDEDGI